MRQITYDAARAFIDGKPLTLGNTCTYAAERGQYEAQRLVEDHFFLYLFGNRIATKIPTKLPAKVGHIFKLTLAGWPTTTTRERLNGVLELIGAKHRLYQKNYYQYYGPMCIGHNDNHNCMKGYFYPLHYDTLEQDSI